MSGRYELDAAYASVMREEGIYYRKIGIEIDRREGRKVPYNSVAIAIAIKRFNKLLNDGE